MRAKGLPGECDSEGGGKEQVRQVQEGQQVDEQDHNFVISIFIAVI
jgi:hypothetical protein